MLQCINKKNLRILALFVVLMTLTLNLIGCNVKKQESEKTEKANNKEVAKEIGGIFSRTLMSVENGEQPEAISKAAEGGLYVVTGDGIASKNIWYVDSNSKWEKKYNVSELLNIKDGVYCKAYITANGEIFAECNNAVSVSSANPYAEGSMEYYLVDAEGQKHEINMNLPDLKPDAHEHDEEDEDKLNHIDSARYIDDCMYAVDANANIFEINLKDYSSKMVFENDEFESIDEFYVCDRTLIIFADNIICYEGLDTHDDEEKMYNRFKDYFEAAKKRNSSVGLDIENGCLWTLSEDKVYRYNLENDSIVEAKAVGTEELEFIDSQITIGENLYALVYSVSSNENALYKYSEQGEAATVGDAEPGSIKIWTLEDSQGFEEAIRCFTDKYPNVNVVIEVGRGSYDSGITVNDAVKNLNSELLSGDGPDIIYFEGINPSSYIESGELYDMTGLVDELKNSGEYFNNILDTYVSDGRSYVVPTSVSILVKMGVEKDIEASRDIKGFVDYIQNKNSDHNTICKSQITHYILDEYYKSVKDELINETISREKLVEFFEAAKNLKEMEGDSESEIMLFNMIDPSLYVTMYNGDFDFTMLNMVDPVSMMIVKDYVEQMNGVIEIPANDYAEAYVPRCGVAISAKSKNIDMAEEYIRIALGEECQSRVSGTIGLRANKKAFKNVCDTNYSAWGFEEKDKAEFDKKVTELISKMEGFDKPYIVDNIFDQIVVDEINEYISSGNIDSAVDETLEKIKLYMAE